MDDIATSQLAFRVALIAGGLWLVSTLAEPLHLWIAIAAFVAAVWIAWEAIKARSSRRALEAFACGVAGGVLVAGLAPMIATPLFALACVCGALGVIASLGSHESAANDD